MKETVILALAFVFSLAWSAAMFVLKVWLAVVVAKYFGFI